MKLNNTLFSTLIILLIIASCNDRKSSDFPMNNTSVQDANLYKELAIEKGDTNAYSNLRDYYMDISKQGLLYPALIMANKYEYAPAYYDVFEALAESSHKREFSELNNLDQKTRSLALDYLILGAEKGNKECKRLLGHYYLVGKYVEMDTAKAHQLIEESQN